MSRSTTSTGQPVGRDAEAEEPAGDRRGLEDLDRVALAGELPGGGEAGGPGADDRDAPAVGLGALDAVAGPARVVGVGRVALEAADGQRALERAAGAVALARRVAGAPERADERRRVEHEAVRLLVEAGADERHVAVGLDARGAGERARRAAGAVDDRLLRHRLGERDVGRAPGDEVRVELVRDRDRAGGLALLAAGAGVDVDEARLLGDRRVEACRPPSAGSRRPGCRSSA